MIERWLKIWMAVSLGGCGQAASGATSADAVAAGGDLAAAQDAADGFAVTEALGGDSAAAADLQPADAKLPFHDPPCDKQRPPIVFAHGFLAASDTWAKPFQLFAENGHCADRLFAFDWNTLDQGAMDKRVAELDAFIDGVTQTTGAVAVDLVGHSAGGGLGYAYLADGGRAKKVRRYAHVASFRQPSPAGPNGKTPTLNLWSDGDLVVANAGDITAATNEKLVGLDHYSVATSAASFAALWRFFGDGTPPAVTEIRSDDGVTLHAKALTLGENVPETNAQVTVWPLTGTGEHRDATPLLTQTLGAEGTLGPLAVEPGVAYAFVVKSAAADKPPVTYYRPAFVRSDPLVYLRTLPSPNSLAGTLLSVVPFDDKATVLIVFSASRAIVAGVDSLTVDGVQLATPELASAKHTAIAFFVFDADGNGQSDGTPVPLFQSFPFLSGVDLFLAPTASQPIAVVLNGQSVLVPHQPSRTGGPVIVVFP